ncbi:MAG: hypothetical protein M3Y13_10140 [Armatimonadota bacterium]|nr:hypothetical protein [Armatimonadota bacterium]
MRFKINVAFQGTVSLELEADTPEAARLEAADLTLADLARAGQADVLSFKIAAREVTPISALTGEDGGRGDEDGPRRPRPSGWYRPL